MARHLSINYNNVRLLVAVVVGGEVLAERLDEDDRGVEHLEGGEVGVHRDEGKTALSLGG